MPSTRRIRADRTPFAVRMGQAREHAGLAQKDAARLIGIAQPTLSELESTASKSAHVAKAAEVYKVRATWLQDGTGQMLDEKTHSERAAFVASMLDQIADPAAFDQACVLCEAFAALAKAGQLSTVTQMLAVAGPDGKPMPSPRRDPGKQTGAARQGRT